MKKIELYVDADFSKEDVSMLVPDQDNVVDNGGVLYDPTCRYCTSLRLTLGKAKLAYQDESAAREEMNEKLVKVVEELHKEKIDHMNEVSGLKQKLTASELRERMLMQEFSAGLTDDDIESRADLEAANKRTEVLETESRADLEAANKRAENLSKALDDKVDRLRELEALLVKTSGEKIRAVGSLNAANAAKDAANKALDERVREIRELRAKVFLQASTIKSESELRRQAVDSLISASASEENLVEKQERLERKVSDLVEALSDKWLSKMNRMQGERISELSTRIVTAATMLDELIDEKFPMPSLVEMKEALEAVKASLFGN